MYSSATPPALSLTQHTQNLSRRPLMTVRRSLHRALVAGAAVAAASMLLAGCSGAGSSPKSSANTDGKLVFGITADPTQMIPWTTTSEQSVQVLSQIYSPLLSKDAKAEPAAGLAA